MHFGFANIKFSSIFALAITKWFLGRVVRHRSAKPFTAVRIRQEPQKALEFFQRFFVFITLLPLTPFKYKKNKAPLSENNDTSIYSSVNETACNIST